MISLDTFYALLSPEELEALACDYALDQQNSVKLSGTVVFLCLLNGLLNHNDLSQRLLEETYHQQTGDTCDHSTFSKCLARIDPAYFDALVALLRRKLTKARTPAAERALRLRFVDATTVTLSAKLLHFGLLHGSRSAGKAHRHVKTVWEQDEDGLPACLHLCRRAAECSDNVALGETMRRQARRGDLFVFDKGCDARKRLLALHDADAFWLTPLGTQHLGTDVCVWHTEAPAPEAAAPPRQRTWQLRSVCAVRFGSEHDSAAARQDWERMPLMVLHLWHYAPRQQKWVAFALLTNLPYDPVTGQIGGFSFAELAAVYAQRWELEVFFKLVKQHLSLSHLISRCENGIRVLLAMTQIAALLLLWYQEQTGIDRGWRSVKFWLANDVEDWTRQVLAGAVCRPG